jgi:OmpA-OmpF porin, OOP family
MLIRCLCVSLTLLSAVPAFAQLQDVAGSKDHPMIKRYEGSIIIGHDFRKFGDVNILLGPVKGGPAGQRNLLTASKNQRVEGEATRILYVAPEGRAPLEVLRNYEQELQKQGFQTIYRCARLECGGERDGWLGEYFLYPQDKRFKQTPPASAGGAVGQVSEFALGSAQDQHYLAAKKSGPQGDAYVGVYIATSGFPRHPETFKHAVVLLDVAETAPMETRMVTVEAAEMAKSIASTGHIALYGIHFDTDKTDIKPESAETLKEIATLLKQDPKLSLLVVGHTDNVGGYDYNMKLSDRRAAAVVQALTAQHGIDAKRLRPAGVGMLAPVTTNDSEDGRAKNRRVELVKQ